MWLNVNEFSRAAAGFRYTADKCNQKAKRSVPFHVFWSACGSAVLDEIEIETRFGAAMITTNTLNPIPIAPL